MARLVFIILIVLLAACEQSGESYRMRVASGTDSFYFLVHEFAGIAWAIIGFVGTVVNARHEGKVLTRGYLQCLALTGLLCIFVPIFYSLGAPPSISKYYFLQGGVIAQGRTIMVFSMFGGLLLGGLVAAIFVTRGKKSDDSRPNSNGK